MHQPDDLIGAAAAYVLLVIPGAAATGVVVGGAAAAGGTAAAAAGGHPRTFPGSQRVISNNQDLHLHLDVIFGIVVACGAHFETSTHSKRGGATWHGVYDAYFDCIHGAGRAYALWADPQAGFLKFRKLVMVALAFHADAHDQLVLGVALLSLQLQAHDIMGARTAAITDAEAQSEAAHQHQSALQQANLAMGLIPPG
jgi:hypothetical protein